MDKKKNIYNSIMIIIITAFTTCVITTILLYNFGLGDKLSLPIGNIGENNISTKLNSYRMLIEKYFLGEINDENLNEGAIRGYIAGLGDPYTEYISKEDMETYLEDTMGNFVGIGIYMVKNTEYDKVQILSTIKGSPAEAIGLEPGDLILAVDDKEYSADDMDKMSRDIKGEEGTKVKLQIMRKNEIREFDITRAVIKVNQVEGKVLSNNIGYIEFTSFDETTAEDFKEEYERLEKQGIKSLIIDLRNNGGGIVDTALEIADFMIDKDYPILYEVDKNGKENVKKSKENPIIIMPIVVLTNENTASASEILAGALKDTGKAKIVGKTTYGKGVIQQILQLTDGSGLKITIEEYKTPNKEKIHEVGIKPDVEVDLPKDITSILNVEESKDTQLQKAIEVLNNK